MRLRSTLVTLLLVSLVVLAGCSAPIQTATADDDTGGNTRTATVADPPTISANGVGTVTADPDLAVVFLSVVATADSADAARADVADRTDQLFTALSDAGVPADAVTTVGYALHPEYDYSDGSREQVGYRAVHSVRVEVAPDAAGDVVDTAVSAADVTVSSVQFTLTAETRESLRAEAIAAAVENARSDADAAASAAGLSVEGVQTMTVGSGPVYAVHYADAASEAGGKTSFQPGPVSVSVTVSVTYRAA